MRKKEHVLPIELFSDLDRSSPVSLYAQLTKIIECEILSGSIPPGTRLENELSLGARLSISRPTIRRAIQELVNAGLLVRRRGVGTQVVLGRFARNA
jgi:DNA-binding GntR family transcriptional regulator